MKICFLAAANSIHSHRWIRYFAQRGHKIYWISFSHSIEPIENISFYELQSFRGNPLKTLTKLPMVKKIITQIQPELLHAHYAGTYGFMGALSGFHPLVVTAWGSDILFAGKSKVKKPFIKFILNKADLLTCDAEHMKNAMIGLGVNSKKINIIYFGTDVKKFIPNIQSRNILNKFNFSNSPTIISLRNHEPVYDVESLIRAIPIILKEFPNANFIIAGKGSEEINLKKLSQSLGILKNIRFVGFISNEELPEYLASSDVYVSTSLSDAGLAASTAEAMACGIPVVITNSGENSLWVKDGESGFLIPPKSPPILAEKVVTLLKDIKLREKFGLLGREVIENRNNYYKEMEKMERLYEEILAPH